MSLKKLKKLNDWIETVLTWVVSAVCLFGLLIIFYLIFTTSVLLGCLLSFTTLFIIFYVWLQEKIEGDE